ncbi:hypothetical protein BC936DRAFT_145087 [Jimgerdemannia flammicorona]|uniref:Uncharacterized protein n=1 Tax=Jimgerdemannia flammicorona TaxID=994334 RepID=A0A433DAY0_9FUNG|nr:hypothetical protein BC936DRAFT_145087 [Jimgerdemannia flammicorona]
MQDRKAQRVSLFKSIKSALSTGPSPQPSPLSPSFPKPSLPRPVTRTASLPRHNDRRSFSMESASSLKSPSSLTVSSSFEMSGSASPKFTELLSSSPAPSTLMVAMPPENILCRICEEMIPANLLSTHSDTCALSQEVQMKQHNCDLRLVKLAGAVVKRKQEIKDRNTPYHDHHNVKDAEQLEKLAKKSSEVKEDTLAKEAFKKLEKYKRQIMRILDTAHKRSGGDEELYTLAKRIVHVYYVA